MTKGKSICKVLKGIRKQVADANDIPYEPIECHHEGDCLGTCPACESEVSYIENQLDLRRKLGKAVVVVGLSTGLLAMTGCNGCAPVVGLSEKNRNNLGERCDSMPLSDSLEIEQLDGDVAPEDTTYTEFLKEDSLTEEEIMETTMGMIDRSPIRKENPTTRKTPMEPTHPSKIAEPSSDD